MEECPHCASLCVVPVVYGKPGPALQAAAERGLVRLAGCTISTASPDNRVCLICSKGWRVPGHTFSASEALDLVRKYKHDIDSAVTRYGYECVMYGRDGNDDYNMECYSNMLRRHAQIEEAWNRFFESAESFRGRVRIDEGLRG